MQIHLAQEQLDSVKSMDSYTTTLRWRKADNFQRVDRNWEAFWGFYGLYKDESEHKMAESFIYAAFTSAIKVKASAKVIELGTEYVQTQKWVKFRPIVTAILAEYEAAEAKRLKPPE